MELVTRLALTASIITALILIAGRFGERVAGLLSGLPFMTAPALLQIGAQRGVSSAAEAALGGVVGGALASLFALAYYAAAGRLSRTATLAFALGCLTAGLAVCGHMPFSLTWAAAMACGCSAVAMVFIGNHSAGAGGAPPSNRPRVRTALTVGLTSAVVATLAAEMHPWLAGLVTAMPIIGLVTVATCHRTRGALAVPAFLRAYVLGSLVKTAFCTTFALCVTAYGVSLALLSATLVSVATGTVMLGFRYGSRNSRNGYPIALVGERQLLATSAYMTSLSVVTWPCRYTWRCSQMPSHTRRPTRSKVRILPPKKTTLTGPHQQIEGQATVNFRRDWNSCNFTPGAAL